MDLTFVLLAGLRFRFSIPSANVYIVIVVAFDSVVHLDLDGCRDHVGIF